LLGSSAKPGSGGKNAERSSDPSRYSIDRARSIMKSPVCFVLTVSMRTIQHSSSAMGCARSYTAALLLLCAWARGLGDDQPFHSCAWNGASSGGIVTLPV
jgi:hypothetical protein